MDTGPALALLAARAAEAGVTLRRMRRRRRSTARRRSGPDGGRARQRRCRAVHRARRRRHDPARAAAIRGHGCSRVRDQLRRDRLPRDCRARGHRGRLPSRADRRLRAAAAAGDRARGPDDRSQAATQTAINDVAIHRKVGERVAELAYSLDGEEAGSVRCDGLVVATPAGSTGYNLANGGPVMAWGVEGFVVSFIAPHSMTARALVAAPDDRLTIYNRLRRAARRRGGRPSRRRDPGRRADRGALRQRRRHDRPAPGLLVLSPAAREVRAPGELSSRSGYARVGAAASRRAVPSPAASPVRCIEAMNSSSCVAREAPLAARGPVAVDVAGVRPAAHGRKRDAEVAGGLGAGEHELALVAWLGGGDGQGGICWTSVVGGLRRCFVRKLRELERGGGLRAFAP